MLKVRDYMTAQVVTANLNDKLHQTHQRMKENDVRHMPVLSDDGTIAGIVSDRDLLRPDFVDLGPNTVRPFVLDNSLQVNKAMTPVPRTVTPEDNLVDALDIFVAERYGALPVVDDAQKVIGILSTVDVMKALRSSLG